MQLIFFSNFAINLRLFQKKNASHYHPRCNKSKRRGDIVCYPKQHFRKIKPPWTSINREGGVGPQKKLRSQWMHSCMCQAMLTDYQKTAAYGNYHFVTSCSLLSFHPPCSFALCPSQMSRQGMQLIFFSNFAINLRLFQKKNASHYHPRCNKSKRRGDIVCYPKQHFRKIKPHIHGVINCHLLLSPTAHCTQRTGIQHNHLLEISPLH